MSNTCSAWDPGTTSVFLGLVEDDDVEPVHELLDLHPLVSGRPAQVSRGPNRQVHDEVSARAANPCFGGRVTSPAES